MSYQTLGLRVWVLNLIRIFPQCSLVPAASYMALNASNTTCISRSIRAGCCLQVSTFVVVFLHKQVHTRLELSFKIYCKQQSLCHCVTPWLVHAGFFTLKHLVSSPLPQLHARLSPRNSKSKTTPSAARTFRDILSWPEFLSEACQLEDNLDDTAHRYQQPSLTYTPGLGMSPAADESEVRGAITALMYSINDAANILGIGVECVGGGNGRTTSFMDLVVRKTGQASNPEHLSALILGAGEVKGTWQLELQPGETLEDMLHDPRRIDACVLALQQASQPASLKSSLALLLRALTPNMHV